MTWETEQIAYTDGRISGAFFVQAFQTGPAGWRRRSSTSPSASGPSEELRLTEARFASLYRISQQRVDNEQDFLDYALHEALALTGSRTGTSTSTTSSGASSR